MSPATSYFVVVVVALGLRGRPCGCPGCFGTGARSQDKYRHMRLRSVNDVNQNHAGWPAVRTQGEGT